jgi:hypothetical protein
VRIKTVRDRAEQIIAARKDFPDPGSDRPE